MIESHFGESAPQSVGIEEELMILDAETLLPTAAVDVLVRESCDLGLPGRLKTELHASVVELNTGVCPDVATAVESLRALRAAATRIAAANGLAIAGAGAHPTATYDSLPVVQEERYLAMMRDVGYAARRQGVNGLHVHVGIESADGCHERLEAVLPWLPVVLALSVNSPFAEGIDTGFRARRASTLRSSTGVRIVRRVGGLGGAPHPAWRLLRVHADLVGHSSASAFRDARDPYRRPADRARPDGAPRGAHGRARRARARPRYGRRGPR